MDVLIIGSGGRESALATKISASTLLDKLYAWPGNPGIFEVAKPTGLPADASYSEVVEWVGSAGIGAIICGPEQPLADGFADLCQASGIPVFGPNKSAALLEGSKAFAKEVMLAADIPTAKYVLSSSKTECQKVAEQMLAETGGVVLKASGLAGGKGVFVCTDESQLSEGLDTLYGLMGKASESVVVEQVLKGRECSFFTFLGANGDSPLGFAVDFKRLKDGDQGPNTGGMGCYTPVEWLPKNAELIVNQKIVWPLMDELSKRGISYCGCLYVGIMWGEEGPSVVEFNVRLGDPECQVLSVADKRDWLRLILEKLDLIETSEQTISWQKSVGVVMASNTYPYGQGEHLFSEIPKSIFQSLKGQVFYASVSEQGDMIKTEKGRVLSVVASGDSYTEARQAAYSYISQIEKCWPSAQFRKDIAMLASKEEAH